MYMIKKRSATPLRYGTTARVEMFNWAIKYEGLCPDKKGCRTPMRSVTIVVYYSGRSR